MARPRSHGGQSAVDDLRAAYDEVPYESYAHPQSAPGQLAAVAWAFGLDPPDVSRSRVLEIGCAAAGNLIPFAATHPLAHTVGVDLSRVAAAVCGHATPGADDDLADPAGFVLAGSQADIVGRRLDDIVPSWLEDLQQRYPRHGLKQHLVAALHAEAKAAPRGRMHLANQAGLPLLIRLAPYPE